MVFILIKKATKNYDQTLSTETGFQGMSLKLWHQPRKFSLENIQILNFQFWKDGSALKTLGEQDFTWKLVEI